MQLLPPYRPLPVPHQGTVHPTHEVRFVHHQPNRDERDLIGVLTVDFGHPKSAERLRRIEALVRHRLGEARIVNSQALLAEHHERKQLSDLDRFRRKMLKVQRAYESDRAAILSGAGGFFQEERLRELDALLERAWQKMEQRYGCKREDLEDETLRAKAEALRARGQLIEKDPWDSPGS